MKRLYIHIAIGILLLISGCGQNDDKYSAVDFDLDKILARGKLVALTGYNAYSYFIYKGEPMGYEYELVKRYADHLGVELEILVVNEIDKMFDMLNNGEGDIIAFNLTVTKERGERVSFSSPLNTTKQVLVQRRPDNWRNLRMDQIERQLIRSPFDLEGKTVHVRSGSSHFPRLQNLSEEIGGDIIIVEADPGLNQEDLIAMVSSGEIEYAVADENVARLNQSYYANIDFSTDLSLTQKLAWAVRKNSDQLLTELNSWITNLRKKTEFYVIRDRYFRNRQAYRARLTSRYFSKTGGQISEYDELLKKYSITLNWDWRILASLIYQESQFDPKARSWAGARGLMQLMPATAEMYGVDSLDDPYQNIEAGMKYLKWLDNYWSEEVPDSTERIKYVLGSYNIGLGHIIDAKNLAEKYGADPQIWHGNVEYYLLQKSKEKYFSDPVVKYGYCRGIETVNYVKEILERFEHYRQFIGS